MANRTWNNYGHFYAPHTMPCLIDCNFIVDPTNGNGLGIRSLKGPGIANVFMNTTQTPAAGNPNPGAGRAVIVFQDNYNKYFGGFSGFVSPVSGTSLTSGLVVGNPYVIVSVGSSTLAQWQTAGVPVGITPAVGVTFIALATSVAGGGAVQAPLNSAVSSIEVIGDPNTTLNSTQTTLQGSVNGSYLVLHFLGPKTLSMTGTTATDTNITALASTVGLEIGQGVFGAGIPLGATVATIVSATAITISAATTASASGVAIKFTDGYGVVAPRPGSTVGLSFYMSNSSVMVKGE